MATRDIMTRMLCFTPLRVLCALIFAVSALLLIGDASAQDNPADGGKVYLELTFPAGKSPAVFTEGWVFGAYCSYIPGSGGPAVDCSGDVTWSGSGTFIPEKGATSRPQFNSPGTNQITLSAVINGIRQEKTFPVQAVRPTAYAALGDPLECLQSMATANLDPLIMTGVIITGSPNVTVADKPAARQGDAGIVPSAGSSDARIETGDHFVLIDGRPAARFGDRVRCSLGSGVIGAMSTSQPGDTDLSGVDDVTRCASAGAQLDAARGYIQSGDILLGDIQAARRLLDSAKAANCRELEPELEAATAAADAVMHATKQDAEAAIASCDPNRMILTRAKLRDASVGTFDEEIAKLDRIIGSILVAEGAINTAIAWRDKGGDLTSARIALKNAKDELDTIQYIVKCPQMERQIAEVLEDLDKVGDLAGDADAALRTCDPDRMESMLAELAGTSNAAVAGKARRLEAAIDAIATAEASYRQYQDYMAAGDFRAAWAAASKARRIVVFLDGATCEEREDRFTDAIRVVQDHYYAERDAKLALESCYLRDLDPAQWALERLDHPALRPLKARIDAAIVVAEEYRAAIDATRSEKFEEADRLMQSTKSLLDGIAETDCPWIREDLMKASVEGSAAVVAVIHFVIKVKGSGYIPHWAGGSWATAGENEEVFTLKRGQDLKTELKAFCERLVGNPEEMVNPPGIPGQVKRPIFWNEGPEIEVMSDKIFEYTSARIRALLDTWVADHDSNHGPLSELKKRYKKRGCKIKDS